MTAIELLAGMALLLIGGEALVRGAVGLAQRLGVSSLLIGLTLVGFGTSTPELVTSVLAALAGSPAIAVGNVVGSNIANILLILGLAAVVWPITCAPAAFRRDGTVVAVVTVLCTGVALTGSFGRVTGVVFLALLAGYVIHTYRSERGAPDAAGEMYAGEAGLAEPGPRHAWTAAVTALGGIALTIGGAHLLVGAAIALATSAGVSETVIGLTLVAVGTSLPELATSVIAALRRQPELAVGNILGSNIYNVLGILGVTALVRPLPVPTEILRLDLWVMLAATALLIAFAVTGWRISRREGSVFLAVYLAYLAVLYGHGAAA